MFLCFYKTYKVSLNRHFNISHSFILLFSILHGLRGPLKPRIPNVYWDFASGRQELNSCCDITRMRPCLRSQSRALGGTPGPGPGCSLTPEPESESDLSQPQPPAPQYGDAGNVYTDNMNVWKWFLVMFGYIIFCASGNPDVNSHVFWH